MPIIPESKINVLVIDDNDADFLFVKMRLGENGDAFDVQWADTLAKGLESLSQRWADVVLLDLFLPDSQGFDTVSTVLAGGYDVPIVIFSGLDDEKTALAAVQNGADDYLVKGQVDSKRLSRVLQYAIRRKDIQRDLRTATLKDELTGLHNRQGFFALAEQHINLSQRSQKGFSACFFVLNNYDEIKLTFGEAEANYALFTVSDILRECFRTSDVLARIGPNEFAVLVWEETFPKALAARIKKNKKFHNAQFNRYKLSLSLCVSPFDPSHPEPAKDLAIRADKLLGSYKNKKSTDEFVVTD